MMRGESGNRQGAWVKVGGQRVAQFPRFGGFHLVLDGDVQARNALILRGERTRKMVGDASMDGEQIGALDAKGDPAAQRIDFAQQRGRRRCVGRDPPNQPIELVVARWRQLVEQRDMRRHMVAAGRKMRRAEAVESTLVRRTHRRGYDDGHGASGPEGRGDDRAACFAKG